ncbi:NAD(P)/FAD-dependent oxidoreductase [Streptomyces sp. WMMC500]|uniref:flavin-containing monooxygenase n=1 Tax=Streptomyces sp. WMMC500 TaxID=3015154 RepID=UPI00248AB24F|nr:NAD(P)/FAD-dependent oxidoreductase [Streptomyces sp. WMMC500]WBB58672.1 NAD(P)/FAD-dependent oxidoreductase [Streptomyces sp. WMMC500]
MSHDRVHAEPGRPDGRDDRPVLVVGGGPAGLATAAALRAAGIRAVVLERGARVGDSWRRHYDALRLHTPRGMSGLPGAPIPRRYGRWVGRDQFARHLEEFAESHELEIVHNVEVARIDRAAGSSSGGSSGPSSGAGPGWQVAATGGRVLDARRVVVATGYCRTPYVPDWAGRDSYRGELLHAAYYRNPAPYEGKDVLVVGAGNTGAEIAVDLADGGAKRVRLAVRTLPHLVRRPAAGWCAVTARRLSGVLPARAVDRLAGRVSRIGVPDLGAYGLPRPASGLCTRLREGAVPVVDTGLVAAVRDRRVLPVPAVAALDAAGVILADGDRAEPDAVIAATGWRRGLEELVGHLDVLDGRGLPRTRGWRSPAGAQGLHFVGYAPPLSGSLREIGLEAGKLAKEVARTGG